MTNSRVDDTSAKPKKNSAIRGAPGGVFAFQGFAMAFFLLSLMAVGCNNQYGENEPIQTDALEVVEGFTLTQTVEGRKAWVLKARLAKSYREKSQINLYDTQIEFYSRDEKLFSTLKSDSGIYYLESGDMKAMGHVSVVSGDSAVLETDSLKWVSKEEKIRTEGSVRVTKGSTIITGDGLVSDPGLDHIEIQRNFRAETKDSELE